MQFFGTYQEYNAIKSAASIQKLLKITAKVLRDGNKIEIPGIGNARTAA